MTKLSSQWWQIHGELCSKSHFSRQQWVTKAIASIPQDCATFPNNCDARECWAVFGHVWHKQSLFWTLSLCSGSELTQSWHKPHNLAFFLPRPQDDAAYLAFLHPNLLEADSVDNQVLLDLASNKGRTIEIWYRRISWGDCFTFLFIVNECNRQSSIPYYKSFFPSFFGLANDRKALKNLVIEAYPTHVLLVGTLCWRARYCFMRASLRTPLNCSWSSYVLCRMNSGDQIHWTLITPCHVSKVTMAAP